MEYEKLEGIALKSLNKFNDIEDKKIKLQEDKFPLIDGNNLTTVFVKFTYCKEDHKIDLDIIPNDVIKGFVVSLMKAFPIVCASIIKAKPEFNMKIDDFKFNCVEHITIEYKGQILHIAPQIRIKKEIVARSKSDMDWLN
jgi:hypothetical protein